MGSLKYDEKLERWKGHEYLIDVDGHVWMIDYDSKELSLVKNTPGKLVLERDCNITRLKTPTALWLVRNRGLKIGYVEPLTQIIKFEYV